MSDTIPSAVSDSLNSLKTTKAQQTFFKKNEKIIRAMLLPLTGSDRPAEWPRHKFVREYGEEALSEMVAKKLLHVGKTQPVPVPDEIWKNYPKNEKNYSMYFNKEYIELYGSLYPSNIEYVTFTNDTWIYVINNIKNFVCILSRDVTDVF